MATLSGACAGACFCRLRDHRVWRVSMQPLQVVLSEWLMCGECVGLLLEAV